MSYARLINEHSIEEAPRTVIVGNTRYNPTPKWWLDQWRYKEVISDEIPHAEPYEKLILSYTDDGEKIHRHYSIEPDPDYIPTPEEQLRADVDFLLAMGGMIE